MSWRHLDVFWRRQRRKWQTSSRRLHQDEYLVGSLSLIIFIIVSDKSKSWWIIYRFPWLDKKQKNSNNFINKKDNKCFQYTVISVTVVLNHEETGKNPERIAKFKPFINKFNWEEIHIIRKRWLEKIWKKII